MQKGKEMYKKSVMLVQSCCFAFKTFVVVVVVVVDVLVAIISSDRKVPITKLHRKLGRNSPLKIAIRRNTTYSQTHLQKSVCY